MRTVLKVTVKRDNEDSKEQQVAFKSLEGLIKILTDEGGIEFGQWRDPQIQVEIINEE